MRMLTVAGLVATALAGTAQAAGKSGAASFLTEAIEGDNSEMTLGSLAAKRGVTPGVRRFGAMLASDHGNAKAEAATVARKLQVPVTSRMAPQAVFERTKLASLSGRAFDREFARYMIKDHRKDVARFSTEANSGDAPIVTALARKSLPVLRKHLATARSLAR